MAWIDARMDSRRLTLTEQCAQAKVNTLTKIANDIVGWQMRVQECMEHLEDHWCEVECNAAHLHVLLSKILVSLHHSRTLFAMKL
eukprot:1059659-Rhodomonas_salina.1